MAPKANGITVQAQQGTTAAVAGGGVARAGSQTTVPGAGAQRKQRPIVPAIPLPLLQRKNAAASSSNVTTAALALANPTPSATLPSTPVSANAPNSEPAALPSSTAAATTAASEAAPLAPSPAHTPTSIPVTATMTATVDDVAGRLSAVTLESSLHESYRSDDSDHINNKNNTTNNNTNNKATPQPQPNGHVDSAAPPAKTKTAEPVASGPAHAKEAAVEGSSTPSSAGSPPTNATTPPLPDAPVSQMQAPPQVLDLGRSTFDSARHPAWQLMEPCPPASVGYNCPPPPLPPASAAAHHSLNRMAPVAHMHTGSSASAKELLSNNFPLSPLDPPPGLHANDINPPPGFHMADNRQGYGGGSGPHPYQAPFRRGPVDGFPPQLARIPPPPAGAHHAYGPSTPHNLRGPQLPAQEGFGHFGPNGAGADRDARVMLSPPAPMMPHPPNMMPPAFAPAEGLREYIREQFSDPLFTDCELILALPVQARDHHQNNTRFPGHAVIFARSATLRHELVRPGQPVPRSITLVTDDKNIRADSFYLAVRRLYGYELLDPPDPQSVKGGVPLGTLVDRFDYALGYAASGHLLRWESVTARGMAVAARHIDWPVLERALGFVLGSIPFRGAIDRDSQLPYGPPSNILISGIIDFVIHNLPINCQFDKAVDDPDSYARIPDVLAAISPRHRAPVVYGTSMSHAGPFRDIKFGDMVAAPSSPVPQVSPAVQLTISRVLLNLPFMLLKPVLENMHASPSWTGPEDPRHQVFADALREREARRRRALDAVIDGRVPSAAGIQRGLQSPHPRALDEWDVLGWTEDITGISEVTGAPILLRQWTPLRRNERSVGYDGGAMYP